MLIIVRRTKSFVNGAEVRTVVPGPAPQLVPDWVRDTNAFKMGVQSGTVMEVEVKSDAPLPEPVPARTSTVTAAAVTAAAVTEDVASAAGPTGSRKSRAKAK